MPRRKTKAERANQPDLKQRGREEAKALLRLVERAEGFALAFVRSNAPLLTARFLAEFEQELRAIGKKLHWQQLNSKIENLLDVLLAIPKDPDRVIVVTGLEHSIATDEPATVIHRMNLQREGFRQLSCPLLIFVPDYVAGILGREAPDFWSWKTSYFDFGEDQIDFFLFSSRATAADIWGYSQLDAEGRRKELEYQRGLWNGADPKRKIEIVLRQSVLLESLGLPRDAKKVLLERAMPILEKIDDRQILTRLLVRVVKLDRDLGHPRKALRRLEEEILPGLHDLYPRMFWQVELERADLLRELGSKQAARRLLQKEILPALEANGWQPDLVMARLTLAGTLLGLGEISSAERFVRRSLDPMVDILHAAGLAAGYELLKIAFAEAEGRLDETIFRIEKNVLPQLERSGDILTLARIRADLAQRLQTRNLPGDAKHARELLEQAIQAAREQDLPELARWQSLLTG